MKTTKDRDKYPGLLIRQRRKALGISQGAFAAALRITQGAASQWEKGLTNPRIDKLLQIAEVLECSVDDLCGR
jgi:transcriptional regulator with XRE-family HTH domain